MYQGNDEKNEHFSVQQRKAAERKKRRILLLSLLLVLCVSAGGTLAYIVTQTKSVTNVFHPATVSTKVNETIDVNAKKDVTITNTGDADAYIRAAIIFNWVDDDGNVYGSVPAECVTIPGELVTPDGWSKVDDYYYYNSIVPAGESTGVLISSIQPGESVPDGYYLQVTILSSGVQANPDDAVEAAWGFVPGSGNEIKEVDP